MALLLSASAVSVWLLASAAARRSAPTHEMSVWARVSAVRLLFFSKAAAIFSAPSSPNFVHRQVEIRERVVVLQSRKYQPSVCKPNRLFGSPPQFLLSRRADGQLCNYCVRHVMFPVQLSCKV